MEKRLLNLTDDDMKEIFALFTSVSKYELGLIYDDKHRLYYKNEQLEDEYELTEDKMDYARDSYRAIIYWLKKNGYSLEKNGQLDNLAWIEEEFA
ncbi:MAG: hypothetical protein WAU11_03425 [Ignavibacteriaceae bacterium]